MARGDDARRSRSVDAAVARNIEEEDVMDIATPAKHTTAFAALTEAAPAAAAAAAALLAAQDQQRARPSSSLADRVAPVPKAQDKTGGGAHGARGEEGASCVRDDDADERGVVTIRSRGAVV